MDSVISADDGNFCEICRGRGIAFFQGDRIQVDGRGKFKNAVLPASKISAGAATSATAS